LALSYGWFKTKESKIFFMEENYSNGLPKPRTVDRQTTKVIEFTSGVYNEQIENINRNIRKVFDTKGFNALNTDNYPLFEAEKQQFVNFVSKFFALFPKEEISVYNSNSAYTKVSLKSLENGKYLLNRSRKTKVGETKVGELSYLPSELNLDEVCNLFTRIGLDFFPKFLNNFLSTQKGQELAQKMYDGVGRIENNGKFFDLTSFLNFVENGCKFRLKIVDEKGQVEILTITKKYDYFNVKDKLNNTDSIFTKDYFVQKLSYSNIEFLSSQV
jgi:hypothetical protein